MCWCLLHPTLCIQSQSDFVQGHYPVVKEDAAEMCAIQIAAEHAGGMVGDDIGIMNCIEKYITKQVRLGARRGARVSASGTQSYCGRKQRVCLK